MDKVVFSYLKCPDGSNGRINGRRLQAHELAKRRMLSNGIDYDKASYWIRNSYYIGSYWKIAIMESELVD